MTHDRKPKQTIDLTFARMLSNLQLTLTETLSRQHFSQTNVDSLLLASLLLLCLVHTFTQKSPELLGFCFFLFFYFSIRISLLVRFRFKNRCPIQHFSKSTFFNFFLFCFGIYVTNGLDSMANRWSEPRRDDVSDGQLLIWNGKGC